MFLALVMVCCGGPRGPVTGNQWSAAVKHRLDSIGGLDQRYRNQLETVSARYGGQSPEMKLLLDSMAYADSLNMMYVSHIIDTYGWLGPDDIGANANETLFMVVQHSTPEERKKYLPVMRDAVKAGKAKGSSLALLEDRVALYEGRPQLYGSQLSWNMITNEYYVQPLADPDHVDERRAALGLVPMATYIMDCCNLIWDVEAYKKDIHSLKKKE
jgi:hypothetical protein